MGRIRREIEVVTGRRCWTLFDSGARYSYIARTAAAGLALQQLPSARQAVFGGQTHDVREVCIVPAEIEGHDLEFQAAVVDRIGRDEDSREIEILFGAIALQLFNIRLDPANEALDFSHFTAEFVEF
ncbi:MAG: retropepsin-like domain-containing protein [Planctomycetes bacterium]|nr:retropepsin-like domain-containing protein [Planctomycetota bacterium]